MQVLICHHSCPAFTFTFNERVVLVTTGLVHIPGTWLGSGVAQILHTFWVDSLTLILRFLWATIPSPSLACLPEDRHASLEERHGVSQTHLGTDAMVSPTPVYGSTCLCLSTLGSRKPESILGSALHDPPPVPFIIKPSASSSLNLFQIHAASH